MSRRVLKMVAVAGFGLWTAFALTAADFRWSIVAVFFLVLALDVLNEPPAPPPRGPRVVNL